MAFNYEYPYVDPNRYNDDWLLHKMKDLLSRMDEMEAWKAEYSEAYDAFKKMVEDIENGTFPDSIINAFNDWMSKNALNLVGELVHAVFFELNDEGYFVANIPDEWSDIQFGTSGLDDFPVGVSYGHLTLSY